LGLLDSDVFTVVDDLTSLVWEQALRERFVQWCGSARLRRCDRRGEEGGQEGEKTLKPLELPSRSLCHVRCKLAVRDEPLQELGDRSAGSGPPSPRWLEMSVV